MPSASDAICVANVKGTNERRSGSALKAAQSYSEELWLKFSYFQFQPRSGGDFRPYDLKVSHTILIFNSTGKIIGAGYGHDAEIMTPDVRA
jgi:hypothetical protein